MPIGIGGGGALGQAGMAAERAECTLDQRGTGASAFEGEIPDCAGACLQLQCPMLLLLLAPGLDFALRDVRKARLCHPLRQLAPLSSNTPCPLLPLPTHLCNFTPRTPIVESSNNLERRSCPLRHAWEQSGFWPIVFLCKSNLVLLTMFLLVQKHIHTTIPFDSGAESGSKARR